MAGERSEMPKWTASDLQGRYETLHGLFTNSAAEAKVAGRDHFDFVTEQYGRILVLLEDAGAAVMDVHLRDDRDDPKYSFEEMQQTEADVMEFLNESLAECFHKARVDAGGPKMFLPPFPKKNKDGQEQNPSAADQKATQNIANLRTLITHFSWLQTTTTLQPYHPQHLEPHQQWMSTFIEGTLPEPRRVWWQGDILGNADFEGLWAEFQALETGALSTDCKPDGQQKTNTDLDNRKLVENSQNILLDAFGALLLNPDETGVTWEDLQGRHDDVPGYLTYSPWEDAFWEGAGNDGAQFLMENLGYVPANGETKSHMRADPSMMSSTMEAMNRKIEDDYSKGKKAKTSNSNSSNSSKRSAPSPDAEPILYGASDSASTPRTKKQKTNSAPPVSAMNTSTQRGFKHIGPHEVKEWGKKHANKIKSEAAAVALEGEAQENDDDDSSEESDEEDEEEEEYYLLNDAVNDIVNMRAQIGLEAPLPEGTLLVTPVEPMQGSFVSSAMNNWNAFTDEYDAIYRFIKVQLPLELSATEGNRRRDRRPPFANTELAIESNLARLKRDLEREHATMKVARAEPLNDTARLKQWRITAWQIRYLRSLQLALLLLTAREGSREEFDRAYDRRLEEWVEHEMAWVAHDKHSLHFLLTNARAKEEARARIRARKANIDEWDTILEEMGYPVSENSDSIFGDYDPKEFHARNAPPSPRRHHVTLSADAEKELAAYEEFLDKAYKDYLSNPSAEEREWAAREERELEAQRAAYPQIQAALLAERERENAGRGEGMMRESGQQHGKKDIRSMTHEEIEEEYYAHERAMEERHRNDPPVLDEKGNKIPYGLLDERSYQPNPPPAQKQPVAPAGRKPGKKAKKAAAVSRHRIPMEGRILGSLTYDTTGPDANQPAADPNSAAVFAEGGPSGFRGIPTETVYEKLQYMIILTYWRCWMAAETGL